MESCGARRATMWSALDRRWFADFVHDLGRLEIGDRRAIGLVPSAVGLGRSAGAKHFDQKRLGSFLKIAFQYRTHGIFDRVFDAFELDALIVDHRVRSTRVAVAGLADAAGIDDQLVADFEHVGMVGVPDTDDTGVDVAQPPRPELDIGDCIFIEWIARRRMNEKEPRVVEGRAFAHRQRAQIAAVVRGNALLCQHARHCRQILVTVLAVDAHVLGNAVIVIAADRIGGALPDPFDARARFQSIIDQIAEHNTNIERLLDGLQGGPIGVDISQQQDAHRNLWRALPINDSDGSLLKQYLHQRYTLFSKMQSG